MLISRDACLRLHDPAAVINIGLLTRSLFILEFSLAKFVLKTYQLLLSYPSLHDGTENEVFTFLFFEN